MKTIQLIKKIEVKTSIDHQEKTEIKAVVSEKK